MFLGKDYKVAKTNMPKANCHKLKGQKATNCKENIHWSQSPLFPFNDTYDTRSEADIANKLHTSESTCWRLAAAALGFSFYPQCPLNKPLTVNMMSNKQLQ